MTELLRAVLAAMAVYRLARLLVMDDGPFGLLRRARDGAAIRGGDIRLWETVAELYSCTYCLGVWLAALGAALVARPTPAGDLFLLWMGLAGAQAFLQGLNENLVSRHQS